MKNCLMIMNPRNIPIVMENFDKINIPKVYFRAFTEKELEDVINNFILDTNYDNYILTSDDVIVTQEVVDIVEKNLETYKVFTGYCNMTIKSKLVNLTDEPITLINNKYPISQDYKFITFKDVEKKNTDIFKTYLAGFALTGMRRDLWLKYPFKVYLMNSNDKKGVSSDHNLSIRLNSDNIPIYTHKNAFVKHLKGSPITYNKWLLGKIKSSVILPI